MILIFLGYIKKLFLKPLFKNTLIYSFTDGINQFIPFLLLPILTKYLSPTDYGVTATFQSLLVFLTPFICMNLNGAITVRFYKLSRKNISIYIGTSVVLVILSFVVISIVLLLMRQFIAPLVQFPSNWLITIGIVVIFNWFILLNTTLYRLQNKPYGYLKIMTPSVLINVSFSIFLIVVLHYNWVGRILGILISTFIFGTISLFLLYKNKLLKIKFNRMYAKNMLQYGLPLIPHTLSGWIKLQLDRIVLNNIVGLSATGIYSVGSSFGRIPTLFYMSFNNAYMPILFSKLIENDERIKVKIVKMTLTIFLSSVFVAISLNYLLQFLIVSLINPRFHGASQFIPYFMIISVFDCGYILMVNFLFFLEKTSLISSISVCVGVIYVCFLYYLVSVNGVLGAVQALSVASFLTFVLVTYFSVKYTDLPWPLISRNK